MDIFDFSHNETNAGMPLAEKMRPRSLDEFIGQEHIIGAGRSLRHLIENDQVPSMILQGPPSSGKTSLATIISRMTNAEFVKLNAVSLGVAQLRETFEQAQDLRKLYGKKTIAFIDEIHAMKRNVQETLLPYVENGVITLIGCTTESINHDIIPPLVSRCRIYRLRSLTADDMKRVLRLALEDRERGLGDWSLSMTDEALDYVADICNGDVRSALNALEVAAYSLKGTKEIDLSAMQEAFQFRLSGINTTDMYNLMSAFIKSMRGSKTDAALYWLARMLDSGVDPVYIARRIVVHSAEDVGMANPHCLQMAIAAQQAVQFVGMPEGRIPLAQAVVYLCESPKSNSVYNAIASALDMVRGRRAYEVPEDIRDSSPTYVNPISNPNSRMQYLPSELEGVRFYEPQNSGTESKIYARYHGRERPE
jgi:putative ATPase